MAKFYTVFAMLAIFSAHIMAMGEAVEEMLKVSVASVVREAAKARDAGDHNLSLAKWSSALSLLERRINGDTTVDTRGSVGNGIFIQHTDWAGPWVNGARCELGGTEEETFYNDALSSQVNAANIAREAANEAKVLGQNQMAAELFAKAGQLQGGNAPSQIWHKQAAEAYAGLSDWASALTQIQKAADVAIAFYRSEYISLLDSIRDVCNGWAKQLGDNPMAASFSNVAEQCSAHFNVALAPAKVSATKLPVDFLREAARLPVVATWEPRQGEKHRLADLVKYGGVQQLPYQFDLSGVDFSELLEQQKLDFRSILERFQSATSSVDPATLYTKDDSEGSEQQ